MITVDGNRQEKMKTLQTILRDHNLSPLQEQTLLEAGYWYLQRLKQEEGRCEELTLREYLKDYPNTIDTVITGVSLGVVKAMIDNQQVDKILSEKSVVSSLKAAVSRLLDDPVNGLGV